MQRILEYSILFLVMIILQVFVFSRIGISVYVNPLIYIAFLLLLPMEISGAMLLFIAFGLGITVDFFMATAGINTIASLFTAFCRPTLLNLFVGKDEVKEGGVPNVNRLGVKKFLRYSIVCIVLHHIVFFTLEALTWNYFYVTALRIVLSSAVTVLLVYIVQKFFNINRQTKYGAAD